jgi:hypothetical protein
MYGIVIVRVETIGTEADELVDLALHEIYGCYVRIFWLFAVSNRKVDT